MRSSAELKQAAKRALSGNYGNAAGSILAVGMAMMVLMVPFFAILVIGDLSLEGENAQILFIGAAFIVLIVAYILFGVAATVGYTRMCFKIAVGEEGEVGDLFFAVKNHFPRFLGLMLFLVLLALLAWVPAILVIVLAGAAGAAGTGILLGSLLGLALCVAAMCRYAMAVFALVEDPGMRAMEAMRFSRELMRGNVWRFIRLELSFLGMYLLGQLTMGIGYLWITPYVLCTHVLFYLDLKEGKYQGDLRYAGKMGTL